MALWGPDAEPREVPEALPELPARPRPPERWWDIALVPLVSAVLSIAVAATAMWFDRRLMEKDVLAGGTGSAGFEASPWFLFASMSILYFTALAAIALLLFWRGHRLGTVFLSRGARMAIWIAVPAGISLALAVMALLSLLPPDLQEELATQNAALEPTSLEQALGVFVVAVFFAPFVEELYFRGIMLRVFSRAMPFAVAATFTAALFSLVHGHLFLSPGLGGWLLTGIIFLLGFVLAFLARAGGSLRAPVLLHAAYNATLVVPTVAAFLTGAQT